MELPHLPGGPGSGSGGGFFEQFLADLLRMMGSGGPGGPARLETAKAMARQVAAEGDEPNVDPAERMALEALLPVAELHVAELTGLAVADGRVTLEVVPPGEWAARTVEDWAFLLEVEPPSPRLGPLGSEELDEQMAALQGFVSQALATMGPLLAAMQLGSAVGHLARVALGQYELPVPRPSGRADRLLLCPRALARFAGDWSLPAEDVRLWVLLRDLAVHAALRRPAVAERFRELLRQVTLATALDQGRLFERLQDVDLSDPAALGQLFADPTQLLGAAEVSPARQQAVEELAAATSALAGYVEWVLDRAAERLLGGRLALAEAWRRRQVERDAAERVAEELPELDLGPQRVDRGSEFVRGVVERAGEQAVAWLWRSGATVPTPAELDAPGLWLERVRLAGELPPGATPEGTGPEGATPPEGTGPEGTGPRDPER
ncbi:zinc-dependent metalloprotease [Aciditerrimonas ferrireducens]|uniref:Zinc-dependent metalloprotease n=1 Tax=Aciditerrimonas ferrireducens TaxID=667306 RepID=A0ABV6C2U6_9ACTN